MGSDLVPSRVDLTKTSIGDYRVGRSLPIQALWLLTEAIAFRNPLFVSYRLKRVLLRRFGASVGADVQIKPCVRIKYPWRLTIGDNTWIGEEAWFDNLDDIRIGSNVCISQGAYLCTGNHDWTDIGLRRFTAPIVVADGAWIGAFVRVGPGVTVGEDAVITLGSVLLQDAGPLTIYSGNPAGPRGRRNVRDIDGERRS
jgi:putative colanic acid biosynthesis acetyltransferase WcaF